MATPVVMVVADLFFESNVDYAVVLYRPVFSRTSSENAIYAIY
jgi:hypothetical protein